MRPPSRLFQNLVSSGLHRLAEIACRPRQNPELGSRDASANRQQDEIGAGRLRQGCAGIDGAVRYNGAVGGHNDTAQ
jgi:hypothetical protein